MIKVKAAGNEHFVIKKPGSGNFFAADTFALRRGIEIRAKSLTASVKFPRDRHKNMDLWRCQSSGDMETGRELIGRRNAKTDLVCNAARPRHSLCQTVN
jgi:hypothetical protein